MWWTWGILVAGALGLLAALVYTGLGMRIAQRAARRRQDELVAFAAFWLALALHVAVDSVWGIAGAALVLDPALSETVLHLKLTTGVVAFCALVYHLAYLYSGRRALLVPIAGYFLAVLVLVEFSYQSRGPTGLEMSAWAARHSFERPGGLLEDAALALLFVPGFVCSVAYAALAREVEGARRRRVLFRTVALAGFFGGMLVGFIADFAWWEPAERFLALATGAAALWGAEDVGLAHGASRPQAS